MSLFKKKEQNNSGNDMNNNSDEKNRKADTAQKSIDEINNNIERIKQTFGNSSDLVVNLIKDGSGRLCCASVYILGLSDGDALNSISAEINKLLCEDRSFSSETLFEHISCMRNLKTLTNYEEACQELLLGNTLFLMRQPIFFTLFPPTQMRQSNQRAHFSDYHQGTKGCIYRKYKQKCLLNKKKNSKHSFKNRKSYYRNSNPHQYKACLYQRNR
jgi:hypothetical protein